MARQEFSLVIHHGHVVWANTKLVGKHREHCLCHSCESFKPDDKGNHCPIANLLFAVNCAMHITTPVYECEEFVKKE